MVLDLGSSGATAIAPAGSNPVPSAIARCIEFPRYLASPTSFGGLTRNLRIDVLGLGNPYELCRQRGRRFVVQTGCRPQSLQ